MPCDSIRLTSVQLSQCNAALMVSALTELGLSPCLDSNGHTIYFANSQSIDCATGQAKLSRSLTMEQLKRAYSCAVVKQTAKKFGWAPQANNTNQEFVFNKR